MVWWADPDEVGEGALLHLLSDDERARHDRFHFAPDRHVYAVAHALKRCGLSRFAPFAPSAWRFEENPYGRPEVAPGLVDRPLRFNLSHTRGLVALAVTDSRDVGVDVEHRYPRSFDLGVAESFFAPSEVAALFALPADRQRERFFTYWTLKEAYIKARGMGLALPLDQFAFDLTGPDGEPRIRFEPALTDDANTWTFRLFLPAPDRPLAVAVRGATGERVPVTLEPFHFGS
jgi:4'-phosphopantetheinyl transferase